MIYITRHRVTRASVSLSTSNRATVRMMRAAHLSVAQRYRGAGQQFSGIRETTPQRKLHFERQPLTSPATKTLQCRLTSRDSCTERGGRHTRHAQCVCALPLSCPARLSKFDKRSKNQENHVVLRSEIRNSTPNSHPYLHFLGNEKAAVVKTGSGRTGMDRCATLAMLGAG